MTTFINDLKNAVAAVENWFNTNPVVKTVETDLSKGFQAGLAIVERNGGALLWAAASALVPMIGTAPWATITAQLLTTAKAAGAATIAAEEQLAASTALQVAQAIAGPTAPANADAANIPAGTNVQTANPLA